MQAWTCTPSARCSGTATPRSTKRYSHLSADSLAAAVGKIGGRKVPHTAGAEPKKKAA